MHRTRTLTEVGKASLVALGIAAATVILAQPQGGDRRKPPEPPAEAIKACATKDDGASCTFKAASGTTVSGQCHAPPSRKLACIPEGGRPGTPQPGNPPSGSSPPSGPPPDDQGEEVRATAADTREVLCQFSESGTNPTTGLPYAARWSCAEGQRTLAANGIPDHATGAFPNPGNPNRLAPQRASFSTSTTPVARTGSGAFVKIAGFALNGIKLDPGTAQTCDSACADHGEGHGNPWRIEALGQSFFAFGVDGSNAHVQPGGAYHYHGVPEAMLSPAAREGKAMALIGWAVDGFPIYARFGHADPRAATSPLRAMRSSYRLKARPDAGRPPVDFAPMGTFTQDYEYVAGLGNLDECNGRTDVTPEFPRGIYHYYATDSFPFIQRCVKGTPAFVPGDGPPPLAAFLRKFL